MNSDYSPSDKAQTDTAQTDSVQKEDEPQLLHPTGIREHTDGREFRPYVLLGVIIAVSAVLAIISYVVQIYFIGSN